MYVNYYIDNLIIKNHNFIFRIFNVYRVFYKSLIIRFNVTNNFKLFIISHTFFKNNYVYNETIYYFRIIIIKKLIEKYS